MKVDEFYASFRMDDKDPNAVEVASDLKWLEDDIRRDDQKVSELLHGIFHKKQALANIWSANYGRFNSVCQIDYVFDAFERGCFAGKKLKSKETKQLASQMAANWFPPWMWEGLEFHGATTEGHGFVALILEFTWTEDERTFDFQVRIPNPKAIPQAGVFNPEMVLKHLARFLSFDTYEVEVYGREGKVEDTCKSFDAVARGHLNTDVVYGIYKWVTQTINRIPDGK